MLTDQEIVAMRMLSKHGSLIHINMEDQVEFIQNALDFADLFIDLSRDENRNNEDD